MNNNSKPGEGAVAPETRVEFVTPVPIDIKGVLDEKIIYFLANIAERAHQCLGIKNNEEIDKYILDNNVRLRLFLYKAKLDDDPRAQGIIRFFNFCIQVGCADLLNFDESYYQLPVEMVMKDLKNLIRMTMVAISRKIGNAAILLEIQIPAINGGSTENLGLANEIAEKIMDITLRSNGGNTTEVLSVLMLMRDCFKTTL